jgi:hypothetical protein
VPSDVAALDRPELFVSGSAKSAASERSDAAKEEWAYDYLLRCEASRWRGTWADERAEFEAEFEAALVAGLTDVAAYWRAMGRINAKLDAPFGGPHDNSTYPRTPTPEDWAKMNAAAIKLLLDRKLIRLDYTPPVMRQPEGRSSSRERRVSRSASRAASRDGPRRSSDDDPDVDHDRLRARRGVVQPGGCARLIATVEQA